MEHARRYFINLQAYLSSLVFGCLPHPHASCVLSESLSSSPSKQRLLLVEHLPYGRQGANCYTFIILFNFILPCLCLGYFLCLKCFIPLLETKLFLILQDENLNSIPTLKWKAQGFPYSSVGKEPPTVQETLARFLGWDDLLQKR